MKLAIVSHTEHYIDKNGTVVGWGPTVREINNLAAHFDKIYHVACLHKGTPPPSSLGYLGDNIEFVSLPPSGGDTVRAKLSVLRTMPTVLRTVNGVISKVDYFQLRLPTGMGNYLLPWLMFKKPKAKFWVKYAGNWAQRKPPLGYAFQRWFLTKNFLKCKVTINGRWPGQPAHILSFENPCLTEEERKEGAVVLKNKNYGDKLNFIFVGRVEKDKGVGRIIDAFRDILPNDRVGEIQIIGDGSGRKSYEQRSKEYGLDASFMGFKSRTELNELFKESHVLLLPSASEGFPKVIAEGANYGCVPIVSKVSSIPQYIGDSHNGFLMASIDSRGLAASLERLLSKSACDLSKIAHTAQLMAHAFTYDYYYNRIEEEILQ